MARIRVFEFFDCGGIISRHSSVSQSLKIKPKRDDRMRYGPSMISLTSAGKVAIFLVLAACSAFSQTDQGSISGKVNDQDGATVSGCLVQAKNLTSSAIYKTTSSKSGDYTVEGLPAGSYQISIP